MKHFLPSLFFCLFYSSCWAGGEPFPIGAQSLGMGNATVSLRNQWSLFGNVGGMAGVEKLSAMAAFSSQYQVPGLQVLALGAVLPTRRGNFGLAIQRFGDELYSEHLVGLAYSHQINQVSIGLKVNYVQIAISDLGSRSTLALELGGVAQILPQLSFGAYIYNFNQARLADYQDERIPTLMKAGFSYQPSSQLLINAEVEKDIDFPAVFKTGMEYEIVKNVNLRTGISTFPFTQHFGAGIQAKSLQFDYAVTSHPQLGLSHHLSLAYSFEKKKPQPVPENGRP
jgi:hypothetical protein